MSWYDYANPWTYVKGGYEGAKNGVGDFISGAKDDLSSISPWQADPKRTSAYGAIDESGKLAGMAGGAGRFAGMGERRFTGLGQESSALRDQLGAQARGQGLISTEMLRQGLQQNVAAQQAAAAGARPGMAPMMARTAAMQTARLGSGFAGQQAMAGIAERQAAQQALGNMIAQQRELELRAAQGGRDQALRGYGMLEDARTSRYGADMGVPVGRSGWDKFGQTVTDAAKLKAMTS